MKKRIVIFLCLIMTLSIGIPAIKNTTNSLNAAEGDTDEEAVIDIVTTIGDWPRSKSLPTRIAAITENHNLYTGQSGGASWVLALDEKNKPLENVSAVSLRVYNGKEEYIALRTDGNLYIKGVNNGKFGNGEADDTYHDNAVLVDQGVPTGIIQVESSYQTNYLLTSNGEVYASGDNSHGQFGNGDKSSSNTFTKANISDVKEISATVSGTLYALKNDGTVYGWGEKVFDGTNTSYDVVDPIPISITDDSGTPKKVHTIGSDYVGEYPFLVAAWVEGGTAWVRYVGKMQKSYPLNSGWALYNVQGATSISDLNVETNNSITVDRLGVVRFMDGDRAWDGNTLFDPGQPVVKIGSNCSVGIFPWLGADGTVYFGSTRMPIKRPLKITATKQDNSSYGSEEKYNDSITMNAISTTGAAITCQVEDPVGSTVVSCTDFVDNKIDISIQDNQRIYRKYVFSNDTMSEEFIVDLYKGKPALSGYSTTSTNKIKVEDSISLAVPKDQSWNTYTAKVTDSTGNTTDFIGGTLKEGKYTMVVTDAYGNTQNYTFEVTDKPTPTAVFTGKTNLVYNAPDTKVNGVVGTVALQYPDVETSNIASISVSGTDGSKFSIDNSGELKVKGSALNAGTYNVTLSGKDGNNMAFSTNATITVDKANQDQYQITNNANYPFRANQEIAITTSGNESGGSETFTIISGTAAQISGGNKFKILSSGTFTLQATVAGNTNYNDKTVTKAITISELPMQNPAISINSSDTMMYGDTYRPTYNGGQGSGAVSWSIDPDNNSAGAVLNNSTIKVNKVGSFSLKVTKAGDANVQSSSDTMIITVNPRKTTIKPKTVTKLAGEVFKPNGVTYNPSLLAGDSVGTPNITSKYPNDQAAGMYPDGIQVSGLSNPNYEFVYEDGTLIINSNALPNNGSGYYKITGTKGKNNWYVSDVKISTTGKDGYDLISADGISFQSQPLTYTDDGDQSVTFYLKNSTTGIIAKGISLSLKIDQTAPSVPTLTMQEINTSTFARMINTLSFGNWMKQGAEVTMLSSDDTSGIDYYEYSETSKSGTVDRKSLSGIVTYQKDVELTIKAKACDKAGNCSEESSEEALMIDRKAPTINGVKDQAVYKYYYLPRFVTVSDDGSGLAYAEYTKDGVMAGTLQDSVSERIDGVGEYTIQATDNAGNEETLTFEIVPLPDIDDIDGSDESKEIIDQVQEEYNEIKNQIDDTEKTDIKDWINDALDKWNDSRKKVVETDDKSAKVEGEGDTNFDPRTELIVDEISEDDVPKLPKKPLVVYDVYLRKGTTRIQPDGSIKVYLPLVEASAPDGEAMGGARIGSEPIVYEINTNNKVSQLSVQKEGSFVTFITDHLVKYAISDETQEDNENNNCVVSGDGILNTGDDVCGLPNDKGDQPEKQPDGSVNVPDGGKVEFPNGIEIDTPDGAIIHPDGSVTLPDGTEYDPDGNIKDKDKDPDKDKDKCPLEGKDINVDTDGDGKPDLNVDLDGDCVADLNIDTDFDNIPDVDIDTDGDGKPDINVDTNHDGKADLNIAIIKRWIPKKDCVVNGFAYDTGDGFTPYLNVDDDGDGKPDRNIDDNGDGIPDRNIDEDWFDKYGDTVNGYHPNSNIGGASTGDDTKWTIWWILLIMTSTTMAYSQYRKRTQS